MTTPSVPPLPDPSAPSSGAGRKITLDEARTNALGVLQQAEERQDAAREVIGSSGAGERGETLCVVHGADYEIACFACRDAYAEDRVKRVLACPTTWDCGCVLHYHESGVLEHCARHSGATLAALVGALDEFLPSVRWMADWAKLIDEDPSRLDAMVPEYRTQQALYMKLRAALLAAKGGT